MSFSKPRKAWWKARMSGDSFQLYGIKGHQMSEESLWLQQLQLDLSLTIPERPQRLVIRDGDSVDRFPIPRKFVPNMRKSEEDFQELVEPIPLTPPLTDDQPLRVRPLSEGMSKPREIVSPAVICMV